MSSFKLIAVRILPGCSGTYKKCLQEDVFYYFNNDYIITKDGKTILPSSGYIEPLDNNFFSLSDNYDCDLKINLSAIVGKNGDGKSSLIEIIIRILNNVSQKHDLDPNDSLHFIPGLKAELYYQINDSFYRIREEGNEDMDNTYSYEYDSNDNNWKIASKCMSTQLISRTLFYTLISNYSHYAYNTEDIDNNQHSIYPEDHWLHNVFHKNDGYQTPLSIHPFRSKGNIDMNREKFLSKQRVLATWLRSSMRENIISNRTELMSFNGKVAVELSLTDVGYSKLQEITFREFFKSNRRIFLLGDTIEIVSQFIEYNKTNDVSESLGTLFIGVQVALKETAYKYFRSHNERNRNLFFKGKDWITKECLIETQSDISQLLSLMREIPTQYLESYMGEVFEIWDSFSSLSLLQIQRIELVDYVCDMWRVHGIRDENGNIIKIDLDPGIVFKSYNELTEDEKCLHYLIYKTISIFETYPIYKYPCRKYVESALIFDDARPDFSVEKDEYSGKLVPSPFIQLAKDWGKMTHTTLKLRQTYNYYRKTDGNTRPIYHNIGCQDIKRNRVSIELESLSKNEKEIISQIENMPPPIFYWDILFETTDRKTRVPLETFSSGEKQKLYTLSAIVYHLQNIDTISPGLNRYESVNIILEEIELYFHPEWQRTYCYDLMDLIYKSGLKNVKTVNILFVTHSPYLLSDIPKTNVLFLKDGSPDYSMQENTFGANINGMLKNGFFLPSLPIGKFAHEKINDLFAKLHSGDFSIKDDLPRIYQNILRVGEPALRHQLMTLYKIYK